MIGSFTNINIKIVEADDATFKSLSDILQANFISVKINRVQPPISIPESDLLCCDLIICNYNDLESSDLEKYIINSRPVIFILNNQDILTELANFKFPISDYILKDELTASLLKKSIQLVLDKVKHKRLLAESEQRYKAIYELSPEPFFLIEVGTKIIIDANIAAVNLLGYSKTELVGKPFISFLVFQSESLEGESLVKCKKWKNSIYRSYQ